MPKPKSAPRNTDWLKVGTKVDTSKLELEAAGHRTTQYQSVYDNMNACKKENDGFTVAVVPPLTARVVMNRLNAAMRRAIEENIVTEPKGLVFEKRVEKGGKNVVVRLAKAE